MAVQGLINDIVFGWNRCAVDPPKTPIRYLSEASGPESPGPKACPEEPVDHPLSGIGHALGKFQRQLLPSTKERAVLIEIKMS